jgi:hypothetical protein
MMWPINMNFSDIAPYVGVFLGGGIFSFGLMRVVFADDGGLWQSIYAMMCLFGAMVVAMAMLAGAA